MNSISETPYGRALIKNAAARKLSLNRKNELYLVPDSSTPKCLFGGKAFCGNALKMRKVSNQSVRM